MTIDLPLTGQIPALRQLWQEAFGDNDAFLDGFFASGYSPDRCRCISFDGRLAAALYWFDCAYAGKKLAYIYAVATDRAFRGRGLCRALMADTHRHLKALGYVGAVLVPGSRELFSLYEKLGYRSFCPMQTVTVAAGTPIYVQPVTPDTFARARRQLLPQGGVLQEGAAVTYLFTFSQAYAGEGLLLCGSRESDTFYFQEYLGDPALLPGIVAGLGAKKGVVRIAGGDTDTAMHLSLDGSDTVPAYFGISLG